MNDFSYGQDAGRAQAERSRPSWQEVIRLREELKKTQQDYNLVRDYHDQRSEENYRLRGENERLTYDLAILRHAAIALLSHANGDFECVGGERGWLVADDFIHALRLSLDYEFTDDA